MDVQFYLNLIRRRLTFILSIAGVITVFGIILARVLPTVYIATALLVVEAEQIPTDLATSTVRTEPTEQMQIIRQRVLTREMLVEMANRLKIYAPADGGPIQQMSIDDVVRDMRKRIAIETTGNTDKRGPVEATLVTVSFEAATPDLAAAVANEIVTLILNEDVEMRTKGARETLEFFESEVVRLDRELSRRRDEIVAFKERNRDSLPESLQFRRDQLAVLIEELGKSDALLAEINSQRNRLIDLHGARNPNQGVAPVTADAEVQKMRADLAALAPDSDEAVILRRRIEAAEQAAARAARAADGAEGLNTFDLELIDLDRKLAEETERRSVTQKAIDELNAGISATAMNAVSLDTLERDYANVRAQYDAAVANVGAAQTGDMIEVLSKGQRITVIEQAIPPQKPARPNRKLIALAGAVLGMVAGLGVVLGTEVLKPGIRRASDLTNRLGITPIATIPLYTSRLDRERERMRRLVLMGVAGVLFLIGVGIFHSRIMPLDLLLASLIDLILLPLSLFRG